MTDTLDVAQQIAADIAQVLIEGDLSKLSAEQKTNYYLRVCESLKLNPYTKPFGYIRFRDGGETLYALKNCTDQLRDINKVDIVSLERQRDSDLVTVIVSARLPNGRTDYSMGAVPIKNLAGEALANAMMKAETKAKRRVTLSICGLGWTDESEVDSIAGAQVYEPPALPGAPSIPTREREVSDRQRMITSADDPLWRRWETIRSEAIKFGVAPANLSLPVGYEQLVSQATMTKAQTQARQDQLAREDAARAEHQAQAQGADTEPEATQERSPEPSSPADPWVRNRELMSQAYEVGYKLRALPASTPLDEVELRNSELEQLLQQQTA